MIDFYFASARRMAHAAAVHPLCNVSCNLLVYVDGPTLDTGPQRHLDPYSALPATFATVRCPCADPPGLLDLSTDRNLYEYPDDAEERAMRECCLSPCNCNVCGDTQPLLRCATGLTRLCLHEVADVEQLSCLSCLPGAHARNCAGVDLCDPLQARL